MVASVAYIFLALHIFSTEARNSSPHHQSHRPTTRGVRCIEPSRSVLVRLEIPDLPLWNEVEQIGENIPNSLVLNFTVSQDNHTLLLQDQPFMPLPNFYTPPRLRAPQTSMSLNRFEHVDLAGLGKAPVFDLDYDRLITPRDEPAIRYYNYVPIVTLDLLGAGIAGYNNELSSPRQRIIKIKLKDNNAYPGSTTNPPNHSFEILEVTLEDRYPNNQWRNPEKMQECTLWSWRCADFNDAPWYRYIMRRNFDEFGRIGSLRHEVLKRWSNVCTRLGYWRMVLLIAAIATTIMIPILLGLHQVGMRVHGSYVRKTRDGFEEAFDVYDRNWALNEKRAFSEKVLVCEKPLPPTPLESC